VLDVTFREDDQRSRKEMVPPNLAANLACMKPSGGSMKRMLEHAAWSLIL